MKDSKAKGEKLRLGLSNCGFRVKATARTAETDESSKDIKWETQLKKEKKGESSLDLSLFSKQICWKQCCWQMSLFYKACF